MPKLTHSQSPTEQRWAKKPAIALALGIGVIAGAALTELLATKHSSYEDCILEHISSTSSEYAAAAVEEACYLKYED